LLPDISKWNISKIDNFYSMFYNCCSLSPFPNLDKWINNNKFEKSLIFAFSYINLKKVKSFDVYSNLDKINNLNEIRIKYKNKDCENGKIRLFGEKFVENNKMRCIINIKGDNYKLMEYLDKKEIDKNKMEFEIKLYKINEINNFSYMFYNCNSLLSLPDISKWNINNNTDTSYMFYNCTSLISLPDISKWNINNNTNMS